jgi:type III restriction enzyme
LPVNEALFRVKETEFELSYIVDFTEKDFADRLVKEINADAPDVQLKVLSGELLERLAAEHNKSGDDLFDELRAKGFIDRRLNIVETNREELFRRYPSLRKGLKQGKVRSGDGDKKEILCG